jgi:hypothetical protein
MPDRALGARLIRSAGPYATVTELHPMRIPRNRFTDSRLAAGLLAAGLLVSVGVQTAAGPGPAPQVNPVPPGPRTVPALIPLFEQGRVSPDRLQELLNLDARGVARAVGELSPAEVSCIAPEFGLPARPDSVDVLHYDIHILQIDRAMRTVRAEATVTLAALRDLAGVDFDFAGLTASQVGLRTRGDTLFTAVAYAQSDSVLHVGPLATIPEGDTVAVRVAYAGTNPECQGINTPPGGLVFSDRGSHTFAEPSYARNWFPCHDAPRDKATLTLTVDAPAGLVASGTGVLASETPVGDRTRYVWNLDQPAATYLMAFYLGDYVKLEETGPDGLPLEFFTYPEIAEATREAFAVVPDMVSFFSQVHPFPFPRYAMTVEDFGGGMEHQTNTLIGWFFIGGRADERDLEDLYSHELAHQWWGDMITPEVWRDIWLNEGFATYFSLLFTEHRYGWEPMRERLALMDSVYFSRPDLDQPLRDPRPGGLLSFIEYNKGARVLDMLRSVCRLRLAGETPVDSAAFDSGTAPGDARFFDIFRRYAAKHAYGNVTSADFQAAAEEVLGEDLTWFFDPWLNRTGYPRYQFDWRSAPAGTGTRVRVRIRQVPSDGPPYRMPIQIAYRDSLRELDSVQRAEGELTEWTVDLPGGTWQVVPDPKGWLLAVFERADLFPALVDLSVSPIPSASGFTFSGTLSGDLGGRGSLAVYDVQGRRVAFRDLGTLGPGTFEARWNARGDDGRAVAAGVYFARLRIAGTLANRRLVVLP